MVRPARSNAGSGVSLCQSLQIASATAFEVQSRPNRTRHGTLSRTRRAPDASFATDAAPMFRLRMTRGRTANTAHLVATDPAEARQQWMAVFGRDRADLGPSHAAQLAATEAARYAHPAVPRPESERRGPSLTRRGAAPGLGR
jgi:hypothetical protein